MDARETFPIRLKALREAIGISQDEFAKALNVTRASISYYERGNRIPDIQILSKINEITGCSVDYLLGNSENMNPTYADIGLVTNLADETIDKLADYFQFGDELNFLLCHESLKSIMSDAVAYAELVQSDEQQEMHIASKDYVKFIIIQQVVGIVEDYAQYKLDCIEEIDQSSANCILREIERTKSALNRRLATDDMLRRMEESSEKIDTRYHAAKSQHEERMKNDPIYKFRIRMEPGSVMENFINHEGD